MEIIIGIIVGIILAVLVCSALKGQLKTAVEKSEANDYFEIEALQIRKEWDNFSHTTRSERYLDDDDDDDD